MSTDSKSSTSVSSSVPPPSNSIVLVTGANKGIGYEIVRLSAIRNPKWTILLGSRSRENGEIAINKLKNLGLNNIKFHLLDIDNDESIENSVENIKILYGKLDIVIHNAAILYPEFSFSNTKKILNTNYFQTVKFHNKILPIITPQTGRIIVVSSIVGTWAQYTSPKDLQNTLTKSDLTVEEIDTLARAYVESTNGEKNFPQKEKFPTQNPQTFHAVPYGQSKQFLNAWVRVTAPIVAKQGISLINTCPGYCSTDMTAFAGSATRTPETGAKSILFALEHGIQDSGKQFQDNILLPVASKIPKEFGGTDEE